jgi:hypothetical protein
MIALFPILDRIGDGANHILMAEDLIQLSKEASFKPCIISAGLREGDYEDQIEITIRFKHQRPRKTLLSLRR